MSEKVVVNSGAGLPTILTIVFVVLKLCKVISWSWWWVISPLWISVGFWMIILIAICIVLGIIQILSSK